MNSKSAASSSSGLPLRQLRWSTLPPVDLLDECHWLVTLDANLAQRPKQVETKLRQKLNEISTQDSTNLCKQKSPYRQPLCRPKVPAPSPGSPAQRAAKSILKLKEGLLRLDGTEWALETHEEPVTAPLPQQRVHQASNTSSRSSTRLIDPSVKDKGPNVGSSRVRSPSPRAKTPQQSPSKRKKKRPPTREERDLAQKQARLAAWLKANPDATRANAIENGGRAYRDDGTPGATTPLYSLEVSTRIESAMQCRGPLESGVRLWDDHVRSLIAADMTSESVFGGAVPTRALAFQPPQPASPFRASADVKEAQLEASPPKHSPVDLTREELNVEEETMAEAAIEAEPEMSEHAQKVFNVAHRLVADGAVADALATLEDGIRQSRSISQAHLDAVSGSNGVGFNYSALAHGSATKLQLFYRSRHRRRVSWVIFLQRQWRWWHARSLALSSLQFANKQAMAIQRRYRPWYRHITQVRSALRIQRCFRVFESQKYIVRFRQLCRLLLARKAQRWRLKTRVRMIGKWVLLWRSRRRRIALIQGLWRRRGARAQLEALLAQVSAAERKRRDREDAFVAAKLDKARLCFREFLINTKRGRELVRWQAKKPWLRFQCLRHESRQWVSLPLPDEVDAVARMLPGRKLRGLHQRALCQMLVGMNEQLPALPKQLNVTVEELGFLTSANMSSVSPALDQVVGCCACCPWWSSFRETVKRARTKLSRRAALLWWSLVTYPKEYCAAFIWPLRRRRREQARLQLEDDCARVIAAFLRVWFRCSDLKANSPPFSCEWCSEPFGTSREYFAHGKCAASRARQEAEWAALSSDVLFVQRNKWRLARQPPVRPDVQAFDLDAVSVRRLRRSGSRRKALRSLVGTLEACTTDDSLIPLAFAGFVLQYLDDDRESHPLMKTAEYQLVRWSSTLTQEGYGLETKCIHKDELRSRLLVGSKRSGVAARWRRTLSRRAPRYRAPASRVTSAVSLQFKTRGAMPSTQQKWSWQALQLQLQRLIPLKRGSATHLPTPSSVAGSRVLPVAT